ncbi:MAG: cell division protein SepF [Oscillospiraceae bacterium]|nr:cell division protein SepF [Oscillospiraceae bacterium]
MAFGDLLARFRQTDDEYAEDYEEYVDTSSSAVTEAEVEAAPAPKMSSIRNEKVINMHGGAHGGATLVVLKPKNYDEIMKEAVRFLKENAIVILNLDNVTAEARMRIVDFMTGVIAVIDGKMEKIASCTYTVTPRNVSLQGDLVEYEQFD